MNIPSNYRRVKSNDRIRVGDMFRGKLMSNFTGVVSNGVGYLAKLYPEYTIWRARIGTENNIIPTAKIDLKTPPSFTTEKKNVAVVSFYYNDTHRTVQLVSFDDTYLKGLEITVGKDKPKYQFKCFFRSNIWRNRISLVSFGPVQ